MNDLLDAVLNAHGGLGRRSEASPSTAKPAAGGPFWRRGTLSAQPLAPRANQRPCRAAIAAGRLRGPLAISNFQEAKTVVRAVPPYSG
jgi:hypothetical protein